MTLSTSIVPVTLLQLPCGCWLLKKEGIASLTNFCVTHLTYVFGQLAPEVKRILGIVTLALETLASQQEASLEIASRPANDNGATNAT